jgi:hypothetical protein
VSIGCAILYSFGEVCELTHIHTESALSEKED